MCARRCAKPRARLDLLSVSSPPLRSAGDYGKLGKSIALVQRDTETARAGLGVPSFQGLSFFGITRTTWQPHPRVQTSQSEQIDFNQMWDQV